MKVVFTGKSLNKWFFLLTSYVFWYVVDKYLYDIVINKTKYFFFNVCNFRGTKELILLIINLVFSFNTQI